MKKLTRFKNSVLLLVIFSPLIFASVQTAETITADQTSDTAFITQTSSDIFTEETTISETITEETLQTDEHLAPTPEDSLTTDSLKQEHRTASRPEGEPIASDQYVTIKKNTYTIWQNFNWQALTTTKNLVNQTFHVKAYYKHANGGLYYALYDINEKWQGYLNATATVQATGQQGPWLKTNKYVTIVSGNTTVWQNFNGKVKTTTKNMINKTYQARGYYNHMSGTVYYSLYDNKGIWQGYLDTKAAKVAAGPQGIWLPLNKYVTISNSNYTTWQNFAWKKRSTTKALANQTYQVRGYYRHLNGSLYYSLHDATGKWHGYVNAGAAKIAAGPQGTGFALNKYVTISSPNYTVWQNFSWKKRTTTNAMVNKPYHVKYFYRHANGALYYSLYDANNKWQGYLNASGVRQASANNSIYILLNAPFIDQYASGAPMGCEAASLLEAFRVKGYASNYNLKSFLNDMPLSKNNNPHNGFAGSPWKVTSGIYQSIFAAPLAKWGSKHAPGNVVNISGASVATLKSELKKGNPIVVYVTLDFQKAQWGTYHWGKGVNNAHIMTLDGYNSQTNQYHVAGEKAEREGDTDSEVGSRL